MNNLMYDEMFEDLEEAIREIPPEALELAFGLITGFLLVIGLIYLTLYIIQAIGYMRMAKKLEIMHPWMAFIPLARYYLAGRISDAFPTNDGKRTSFRIHLTLLGAINACGSIAIYAILANILMCLFSSQEYSAGMLMTRAVPLSAISSILSLVALAFGIVNYICLYRIFRGFRPEYAVLFIVISIFFSVTIPFFLLASSKREPQGYLSQSAWKEAGN